MSKYKTVIGIVPKHETLEENWEFDLLNMDFYTSLEGSKTVLFMLDESCNKKTYLDKIEYALEKEKEVMVTADLYAELLPEITSLHGITILSRFAGDYTEEAQSPHELSFINTPVIFVYGLGDNCEKFDMQLALYGWCQKNNYKVLQYGTSDICSLFDIKPLPAFLTDNELSYEDKIYKMNHLIAKQEDEHDLIVIGVPGGIMPLNEFFYNHFSELAQILSNAVKPDVSILNTYFFYGMTTKYLKMIREYAGFRFNSEINYFAVSDTGIQCNRDDDIVKLQWFFINEKKIENYIDKSLQDEDIKIFAVNNVKQCENAIKNIFEEMENNIEVI